MVNITGQTVPFFQDTNKSPGAVTSILNSGAPDSSQSQSPSKTNSSQPSLVHSTMHNVLDSPIRPAGTKRVLDERSNSPESPISQKASKNGSSTQHKRIRMMSDSDSENGSPVKKGTDLSGKTSELEEKLTFLKNACPNVDAMVLQDTLKAHNWKVDWALETLTKKQKPAKNKLKAHHVMEDNSESDDDEFTGKGLVYDSDEEEDGPSNDMTVDKKRVLKFFNEGGEQEMTGIQGCNKKKVSEILKLRPFEGWVDLVTKLQTSKGLSAEMLNSATDLLRMKSAVMYIIGVYKTMMKIKHGVLCQLMVAWKGKPFKSYAILST